MALRLLIGKAVQTSAHFLIKPNPRVWSPITRILRYPLSSSASSSSSSSSCFQFRRSSFPLPMCEPSYGLCVFDGAQMDDWIISLAEYAVHKYNEIENAHLQFVRVVGASHTRVSSLLYYVTLEAVDAGKQKIFHAIVWMQMWKNLMELLTWKPVDDSLSALGVKRGDIKLHEAVMYYMNTKKLDGSRF